METTLKEKTAATNSNANTKKEAFVHNNPVNKEAVKPSDAGKEKEPVNGAKVEQPAKAGEPVKVEPKAEVKTEAKTEPAKLVLNLEGTLKLVEDLHRKKIQRDKLITTINNVEAFEVELREDGDETGGNVYQRCELTIEDDKGRVFSTKNPTIIWTVAQMVVSLCVDKLAEIEAGITIPA